MTKIAIVAILNADDTATDEERRRIETAIAGEFEPLNVSAAADRLGVSRPTIYGLLRVGKLTRLADGRICGKSIANYFTNKAEGRAAI